MLITLAERLRKCHPEEALLARVGGEISFVCGHQQNKRNPGTRARRITTAIAQQTVVSAGQSLSVFATIGVAFYPRDALIPNYC